MQAVKLNVVLTEISRIFERQGDIGSEIPSSLGTD